MPMIWNAIDRSGILVFVHGDDHFHLCLVALSLNKLQDTYGYYSPYGWIVRGKVRRGRTREVAGKIN